MVHSPDARATTQDLKKDKKTRRRLRLSCVECTKRRQKCDRNYPCSLCTTRGVAHLCRWESVPVARPAPARPPPAAFENPGASEQNAIIKQLSVRILSLEQALAEQTTQRKFPSESINSESSADMFTVSSHSTPPTGFPGSSVTEQTSPGPSQRSSPLHEIPNKLEDMAVFPDGPPFLANSLYETTSTLAHVSLAHHGEFIGRGSLICALHSISNKNLPRFLYAKSTNSTTTVVGPRESTERFSHVPLVTSSKQDILSAIPLFSVMNALLDGYFAETNWRFGVPEEWFRTACAEMLAALQCSPPRFADVNTHWLMLLFAVLASAPKASYAELSMHSPVLSCDDYFMYAMTARRITEDDYLCTPCTSTMSSVADGTVLSCLAISLLCNFLSERGRVSEAWKLVGNGIRSAQAVGMHRDPGWELWHLMSEDEKVLRRRAWWGLFIWDKLLSYVLSRPQMIRSQYFDVDLPSPHNSNGSRNLFNLSQIVLVGFATLLGEAMDQCFSVEYPDCAGFLDMDSKLQKWEQQLPPEYRQDYNVEYDSYDSNTASEIRTLARYRYMLRSWYLIARVKLSIASTTGQRRPPQLLSLIERSNSLCIEITMEVIRYQCDAHDAAMRVESLTLTKDPVHPGSTWLFEGCYSLFESAVALIATLAKCQWHDMIFEADHLIERALRVYNEICQREDGKTAETAKTAIEVLTALRAEHWWKSSVPVMNRSMKDTPSPPQPPSNLIGLFDFGNTTTPLHGATESPRSHLLAGDSRYAVSAERERNIFLGSKRIEVLGR